MKKFFISSTFQDMHAERDMIQNIVQPAVNQKLNEQGEYVLFSDLRWGIDTMTDSTERRILDSCFDEIDSCKPYFIVFIGGRYGWIPSDDLLIPYKDRFGDVDIFDKSVTELEVLYALKLNANELGRCLFCFKDDAEYENKDTKKRVEELKQKIEKVAPSQIRHYNTLTDKDTENEFSNQLITDICDILSTDKPLSWQERIANQIKVKYETALPGITSQWLDGLKNESIDLAVLLFPECRVKESFIINFSSQISSSNKGFLNRLFSRNKKVNSIYINVGATKDISCIYDLQKYLIFKICETGKTVVPPIENLSDVKLRSLISNLLTDFVKLGNELYIIISEYDKMIDAQNTKWLPDYIKDVNWVISLSNQSIAESFSFSTHKKSIYGTSHLGDIPFEKQIEAYEKWSGKTMALRVKEAIKALPYADDYMMLEVIFNRLMHFDGKGLLRGDTKDFPEYMEQYIKDVPRNRSNDEAVRYFLRGDFDKFDPKLCEFIFVCMAFFKRGLMISDIEKIAQQIGMPWIELDIVRFLNYESFLLTQYEDGRYDISSSVISNSLVKLYHQKFKFEYSNTIYDYLNGLANEAPIKIDNFWFLCYMSNHFKEYLDYLKALYEVRKDNTDLKTAFLPLFSNTEAIWWIFTSFKKENLKYSSTDFIAELVSIVARTFSTYSPQFVDEFIAATQNVEDTSGDLRTIFLQHYTLALNKKKSRDYKGFVEEFYICLELSEKQFNENPPQLNYLDEDVEHKYPIASFGDILESEYGFSFVENMAALMSMYGELPKEYQDKSKASYYTDKAKEIRTKISKVSYILPEDIRKLSDDEDGMTMARQKPSLLRGKAVELSKQSDREEDTVFKIELLKEAIDIFDKILSMSEDNLVGRFRDSQKTIEEETKIYNECHRDIALTYERLSDLQEGREKFMSLDNAFKHIMIYAKICHNEQSLNDILGITRPIISLAPQYVDGDKNLEYCISGYAAFAEITPRTKTLSFEERLFAELSEDYFQKEIKRITSQNDRLRFQWIQECKNHINSFQSLGNIDAMIWMLYGLHRSFSYYVHELNLHEYDSEHIAFMGGMLQEHEKYLHVAIINSIHKAAKRYLGYLLSEEDLLSVLHIEKMYSQQMLMQGEFDKSLEASQEVIDYCEKNNIESDPSEMTDVEYQARKLNSGVCLERNDIGKAWASIDKIADYAEKMYEQEKCLGNLTELANAKLNQVILWDKMSAEPGLNFWTIEHHKGYDAQKQLYDTYMLCYNFEDKDEQLRKLMRRIRQSHEIIREKGLGYLATPKTLDLVRHYKGMVNDAVQAEKEGRHEECVSRFEKLVIGIRNSHFVDIYFEVDWYTGILFTLGQDAWAKGLKDKTETYYEEAVQLRRELDAEGISQNKESYALLLYFYALVILGKPLSQDSISQVIDLFNKSQETFEEIENQLGPDSLSFYASCCFNLGQIICLNTTRGNDVGLPLIESAINIMGRLVNNYGQSKYERDLESFNQRYYALKSQCR